jgi:hypothetical protein
LRTPDEDELVRPSESSSIETVEADGRVFFGPRGVLLVDVNPRDIYDKSEKINKNAFSERSATGGRSAA